LKAGHQLLSVDEFRLATMKGVGSGHDDSVPSAERSLKGANSSPRLATSLAASSTQGRREAQSDGDETNKVGVHTADAPAATFNASIGELDWNRHVTLSAKTHRFVFAVEIAPVEPNVFRFCGRIEMTDGCYVLFFVQHELSVTM
jgi:hypothetical protein